MCKLNCPCCWRRRSCLPDPSALQTEGYARVKMHAFRQVVTSSHCSARGTAQLVLCTIQGDCRCNKWTTGTPTVRLPNTRKHGSPISQPNGICVMLQLQFLICLSGVCGMVALLVVLQLVDMQFYEIRMLLMILCLLADKLQRPARSFCCMPLLLISGRETCEELGG